MADDPTRELFDNLNSEHPDYVRWKPHWQLVSDLSGETEPDMKIYLPKGEFESTTNHNIRMTLAEFIPETPIIVDKVVRSIYGTTPTRVFKDAFYDDQMMKNADLRGTTWPDLVEQLAARLLNYGCLRTLVNQILPQELKDREEPPTVAELQQANVRPYVVDYNPLSVIHWETDEVGRLTKVRIREVRHRMGSPTDGGPYQEIKFIEYDRMGSAFWVFKKFEGTDRLSLEVDDQRSTHGLGIVPMVTEVYPREVSPIIGGGFVRWIAKADKRKIQAESDMHWDAYHHAHPTLVYKGDKNLGEIGVGATNYAKIAPGEELSYITMNESTAAVQEQLVRLNVETIQRHSGTDPLGVIQPGSSIFQASGVRAAWSFGTSEGRILKDVAQRMQRAEIAVFERVERWRSPIAEGEDPATVEEQKFNGEIQYPEEFDPSSVQQLMDNTERVIELVPSETLHKVQQKRVAAAVAGEVKPETMRQINDEIDKAEAPKPPGDPFQMPELQTAES